MSPRIRRLLILAFLSRPVCAFAEPLPQSVAEAMQQGYQSWDPQVLSHAAQVMEAHLETDPGNQELQRALAILYLDRLKAPAKALPLLEKVTAALPAEAGWHQGLARALRATGQAGRAAEHYRKAAELQPGDAWSRYELGNTLAGVGRYKEAIAAYHAALEFDPRNIDMRLALAKTLWADGQAAESQKTARAILDDDMMNAAARRLLATTTAPEPPATNAPPAAAPAPKAAPKPVDPIDAAVARAYSSGRRADLARAAGLLESSLRLRPRDLSRRKSLGYLYLEKLHDPARAIPHLEKVVAARPRDAAWLQILAQAQGKTGDRAAAAETYRRAVEHSPREVWAHYHLGCVLRDLGRRDEAEAAFRAALALDPRNRYVRRELARCAQSAGRLREARDLARELLSEDARDAEAHAILGDVYRADRDFAAAGTEYQAALASDPAHPVAVAGIRDMHKQQRPEVRLAFYTFEDTDDLRQTGIFSNISVLLTGRLRASSSVNERFFKQAPNETSERFEFGLGLDYRLSNAIQAAAGVSDFKTSNREHEPGANIALYVQPMSAVDLSVSYRAHEPVNDSYITAHEAFTQDILAGAINVRPVRNVVASVIASTAEYSDDNERRNLLASLAWYIPVPTSPVARIEYEWLDFARRTSAYSSPDNYTRLRPVLEWSPKITDWLKLEMHAEASYVFDEEEWGTGITVGPRFKVGDTLDLGFTYMKYEIPGGQTTWSGEGYKVDLSARF